MEIHNNYRCKLRTLLIGGIMMAFGLAGSAWGNCNSDPNDPSIFNVLVDASSSCSALSSNMTGCEVGSSGSCVITNPNNPGETITFTLDAGSVGGTTPLDWSTTTTVTSNPNAGTADTVIFVGALKGGSCLFSYSPGSDFGLGLRFDKSNGSTQKINKIFACSDFTAPPPDVPRFVISKTVTTESGICGTDDVEVINIETGNIVKFCYIVENISSNSGFNVVLTDDNGTPGAVGDDFNVPLTGLTGGGLAGGGTATGESGLITITEVGERTNTATVTGDNGESPPFQVSASDTATVIGLQGLVACPPDYQVAVDQLVAQTGEFPFAILHNPRKPDDLSVCTPSEDNPAVGARRVRCVDECVLKPGCDVNPSAPGCAPQVCQSSEVWTTHDEFGACQGPATPGENDPEPFCWEVMQDLNQDCTLNPVEPMKTHETSTQAIHTNPYVYKSCYKAGGRKVCEMICYLYPGEDSSVCPSGSTVVQ